MERIVEAARRAVPQASFSDFVRIGDEDEAETRLWRASASGGGLPPTVVFKTTTAATGVLQTEANALAFLNDVPKLAPRLYGYDRGADFLVQEDLGKDAGQHLGEILIGDNYRVAIVGLKVHADALAYLHNATAGRAAEYPVVDPSVPKSRHRVHRLSDLLAQLPVRMRELNGRIPDRFEAEVEAFLVQLRDPGPFLTLGHGDATPANAFLMPDGRARLFDFETAGLRHSLIDGSFPTIRYLHSVWACALPRALRWELSDRYRSKIGVTPQAFDLGHAAAGAAWLAGLLGFYEDAVADGEMWGMASARARVVAGLAHFIDIAATIGQGSAIAEAADELRFRLDREWFSPRMPDYPAIGS